jgi:hypothetical protein
VSIRPIHPANEAVLRKRFPYVLHRLSQAGDRSSDDCFYKKTENGLKLFIRRGEKQFPAYGDKKPEKLIERWLSSLVLAPESLYGISGFGDGSHLLRFLEDTPVGTNLFAAEKDPALLRETLSLIDVSSLLANERFFLGVGEPDDEFFRDIETVALNGVQDVDTIVFSPLYSLDEGYYDRMRNEMIRQYLVIRPLIEVNVRTAVNIQKNTFENLSLLANSPDIGQLANHFADVPFILIGAGPSLDDSIDFLKSVRNKAIIVCSNSPFRKLINSGIRPHLVVTADPMPPTLQGFQNVALDGIPLAAPYSAFPEIIRRFAGRVITWNTLNPIVAALKGRTGIEPGIEILEKGTVSSCVLDISRVLGCKKVLFIGQDMAIRHDGKYYVEDSAYGDSGSHYASLDRVQNLPGNTLEKVPVEGRLFVYLKTFQEFIAQNPQVQYRNLAEFGALVKGAPYLTFEQASEWIMGSDSSTFEKSLDDLFVEQNKKAAIDLNQIYAPTKKYVELILEQSLSAALRIEMLPAKYAELNYSNNSKLKQILELANKVNAVVDSSKLDWSILFEGRTKGELVNYRRAIRHISDPNENWANICRNKEYYWALVEGAHWLLSLLDKHLRIEGEKEELAQSV